MDQRLTTCNADSAEYVSTLPKVSQHLVRRYKVVGNRSGDEVGVVTVRTTVRAAMGEDSGGNASGVVQESRLEQTEAIGHESIHSVVQSR